MNRPARGTVVCTLFFAFELVASQSQRPQAAATASIQGIAISLGTNDPVIGADVELTRLEGTPNFPLSPGAREAFVAMGNNPVSVGAAPPSPLASEIQYTRTGERGEFAFRNLKPGGYRLAAVHTSGAYYPAEYGQRNPAGRGLIFPVLEGEAKTNIALEMAATGAISGKVQDADGEPMSHALVMALQYVYEDGRRTLRIMRGVTSDERGEYRLFWLSPGSYYVAAKSEDPKRNSITVYIGNPGRYRGSVAAEAPVVTRQIYPNGGAIEETQALVYYGDVLDPEKSQLIDVRPGTTFGGADIAMGAGKMRAHHVRGILMSPARESVPGIDIRAVPVKPSPSLIVPMTFTGGDGSFDLDGVLPGRYALVTSSFQSRAPAGGPVQSVVAYSVIEVGNNDINDFKLVAAPPVSVSGRATIEGRVVRADDPDLARIRVRLSRDPDLLGMQGQASSPASAVTSAGTFTLQTSPGDYRVIVSGMPPNTYVKSIRAGSEDILSAGLHIVGSFGDSLEIVIGADSAELTGTAVNGRIEPMANVVVLLLPELRGVRRSDLAFSSATDATGRFQLPNIPPGDYKLFAWEYVDPGAWLDASFITTYEAVGKSIRVAEGTRQEIQVTVTSLKP